MEEVSDEREEEVLEEVPGGVAVGVRGVKADGRLWNEFAMLGNWMVSARPEMRISTGPQAAWEQRRWSEGRPSRCRC